MRHADNSTSLDPSLLEKVRYQASGKLTARCPACAEGESDRTGNHLVVFPDGRFACAAYPGDGDHRRRIYALVGIPLERNSSTPLLSSRDQRRLAQQRQESQRREKDRLAIVATARQHRHAIIARHPWHPDEVWDSSPQRIDCPLVEYDPRHFLSSLFPATALLWAGEVTDSGKNHHARHWRTVEEWSRTTDPIGPMTTPATWHPGTCSRSSDKVLSAPYTVLDFDGFDGIKPSTPDELNRHLLDSLAILRWLKEVMHWSLATILWTGSKSLHAWFHTPPAEVLRSLLDAAVPLGIDPGLISRPEHPCRLPGQTHQKTGNLSQVLWLQIPSNSD
jgi:hypothetical protein